MKLFNKGLLLIALPALLGLMLLGAAIYSQEQATDAIRHSVHSKEVIEQLRDIMEDVLSESGRFRGAILAGAPSVAPDAFWDQLDAKAADLQTQVSDNPAQARRAAELRRDIKSYGQALAKTYEITQGGDKVATAERYQALAKSGALLRLRAVAEAFSQEEKKLEAERLAIAEAARERQVFTIVLVVLLSLVVSVGAVYLFARGIGTRLKVVTGNAQRLAERRELLPPVGGSDEIAEVDAALHAANVRLLEAAQQHDQLQTERVARADAEHAARLKDEFVVTLSHELRTPLHSIIGWAEILMKSGLDEERLKKGLEVIHRNAKLQAKMVNDLLEMGGILTGRVRLEIQRVNLSEIIEQVILTVLPTAEARQIRIVKILGSAEPIQGDPARLHQMIWNLFTNAVKFTARGGKIQVSLARVGSEIVLSVTDTGRGISPEFLPYVFDRFRQEDTGLDRSAGGLGLGLSIVRQLTELHGGRAEAHSDGEGKGATFTLRFPVPSAHVPNAAAGLTAARVPGQMRPLDKVRALVVEDDTDARELVVQLLSDAGATVISSGDAQHALHTLQSSVPFDIVVSDIGMPGMDGYEFIARMRQQEQQLGRPRVPAIALTALARTEDRQNALLAGFHAHVVKPVNPAELTIVIVSALGRVAGLPRGVA